MKNLKTYLLENVDVLQDVVDELNAWNGCLEHLRFYDNNEDFFNTYFYNNPAEAVRAAHYGEYNYADDYVTFDAYGNLASYSEYEMERELKECVDEIIEELAENYQNICIDDYIKKIFKIEVW